MNVSKERLSIVGKMIGIYREEKRANTQNSFTQKRFCMDICSTNTLKNIECGELARSLDVYDELLAKLDLKLGEFPAIDMAVLKLTDDLYDAIEFYDTEKINKILMKLHRVLEKVQDYVYYSELNLLFECVRKHYVNKALIEIEMTERFKLLMYIFPNKYADLYRFLIYTKMKALSIRSKEEYSKLVIDISLDKAYYNFNKIHLIDYYYITNSYKTMENLIDELIVVCTKDNKLVRLFDVLNYAIVLLSNVEYHKCLDYVKQAEYMLKMHKIPDVKVSELYSNIAVAYHINNKFDIALKYFNKMTSIEHRHYIDSYIFMADCQNHLELPIDIPIVDEEHYAQYPDDVKLMYKYFTFGSEYPAFSKENYILKKILPNLTDDSYIKIFRYEILKLVNKTGHYKTTHVFDSKIEENRLK